MDHHCSKKNTLYISALYLVLIGFDHTSGLWDGPSLHRTETVPQLICVTLREWGILLSSSEFPNTIRLSRVHTSLNPCCIPGCLPLLCSTPFSSNSWLQIPMIPITEKYVQEMGDIHRSHGNFILINPWQELAARASRHSSRLPEVDPIFCLNRH